MLPSSDSQKILEARLRGTQSAPVARVLSALPHSLIVELGEEPPHEEIHWDDLELASAERTIHLGRCSFYPHLQRPLRRSSDPRPQPGHGRLVPRDAVFDFRALFKTGVVVPLGQRLDQLPLVLSRKRSIAPAFRDYASELVYDLQVFRSVVDQVDRQLADEPDAVAEAVREAASGTHWEHFRGLFDQKLDELRSLVAGFSKQEHEVHGFYFRKHVWDMILSSSFMARTNIRPRGYAGDSEMMRMIYEDKLEGPSIFSRFMHRHPIRSAAAQAVRNRRSLLGSLVEEALAHSGQEVLRVMSLACGPAEELRDVVTTAERARRLSFTLLDQDEEALAEAQRTASATAERVGAPLGVELIRRSVRTMLRGGETAERKFHFIYTMGLFDYLTGPVARAVLSKLYDALEPGGEIVVGNFHVENPTRVYMEYWMDWVLYYRTESEMLSLADGLSGCSASVAFEDTKSQMFLRITKRV